jgi:hypothetical protein
LHIEGYSFYSRSILLPLLTIGIKEVKKTSNLMNFIQKLKLAKQKIKIKQIFTDFTLDVGDARVGCEPAGISQQHREAGRRVARLIFSLTTTSRSVRAPRQARSLGWPAPPRTHSLHLSFLCVWYSHFLASTVGYLYERGDR